MILNRKNWKISVDVENPFGSHLRIHITSRYYKDETVDEIRTDYMKLMLEDCRDMENMVDSKYFGKKITEEFIRELEYTICSYLEENIAYSLDKLNILPDNVIIQEMEKIKMMKELTE